MGLAFQGPFSLIVFTIFRIAGFVYNHLKYGKFIDFQQTNFFDQNRKFKSQNLIPLFTSWYANCSAVIWFTFAFIYAKKAGLN